MSEAVGTSLTLVAYMALFFGVGLLFIFVNLLVGYFVRPADPHPEKLEIYECGEPTIGTSFVQFDLRFYVVALLFIIFDVEVAFFFPWATVFGKSTHMADANFAVVERAEGQLALTAEARGLYQELGVRDPVVPETVPAALQNDPQVAAAGADPSAQIIKRGSRQLALVSLLDIAVFFAVLLVGFAYVWRRGDLDWVRAVTKEGPQRGERGPPPAEVARGESVLSA